MKIPYFITFSLIWMHQLKKIQISLNKSSNFMTQILLKSTCDGLSNDILIIFFEHMVKNISLVKDGMLIVIRSIMITFSTFCANQIDFSRFWGLFSNPIILITTYRIEMIESALQRWDIRLSNLYKYFDSRGLEARKS